MSVIKRYDDAGGRVFGSTHRKPFQHLVRIGPRRRMSIPSQIAGTGPLVTKSVKLSRRTVITNAQHQTSTLRRQ